MHAVFAIPFEANLKIAFDHVLELRVRKLQNFSFNLVALMAHF
jgi:hypothetical protein